MDNKVHNFEVTIDDFQKNVVEIAVDSKKIESFSNSCVELYKNIVQNNTYRNILSQLVSFNKEFPDQKDYLLLFVNVFNLSFCCYMISKILMCGCNADMFHQKQNENIQEINQFHCHCDDEHGIITAVRTIHLMRLGPKVWMIDVRLPKNISNLFVIFVCKLDIY